MNDLVPDFNITVKVKVFIRNEIIIRFYDLYVWAKAENKSGTEI